MTNVWKQTKQDRISLPLIATRLRVLAMQDPEILKIVLGHTSKRYTLSTLVENYLRNTEELKRQIYDTILGLFGGNPLEIYVLSKQHQDAQVFNRWGTYQIYPVQRQ